MAPRECCFSALDSWWVFLLCNTDFRSSPRVPPQTTLPLDRSRLNPTKPTVVFDLDSTLIYAEDLCDDPVSAALLALAGLMFGTVSVLQNDPWCRFVVLEEQ